MEKQTGQDRQMIDFKLFQFACPPRCGTSWFVRACQLAGLGQADWRLAHVPFSDDRGKLRVTVVRHPYTWLRSCYLVLNENAEGIRNLERFRKLNRGSFAEFVSSYLTSMPGAIGELFDMYWADTVLRLEDMPWALLELFESVGAPKHLRDRVQKLEHMNVSERQIGDRWMGWLKQRVMEAERELIERYDYY